MKELNSIGSEIRRCCRCKEEIINIPQPGYFKGKILFIFQNPAMLEDNKWQDEILKDKTKSIEDINNAYKSTLQYSKLGNFINDLNLNWDDISISNLVKCPTFDNMQPDKIIVNNCLNFILQQIDLLKPKVIILCGALAHNYLFKILENKYNILCFYHYAFLKRNNSYDYFINDYKKQIKEVMYNNESQSTLF